MSCDSHTTSTIIGPSTMTKSASGNDDDNDQAAAAPPPPPAPHLFGGRYERQRNILRGSTVGRIDDQILGIGSTSLLRSMVNTSPKKRRTIQQVIQHPYFWDASQWLRFLEEFSDRVGGTLVNGGSSGNGKEARLLAALETSGYQVFGSGGEAAVVESKSKSKSDSKSDNKSGSKSGSKSDNKSDNKRGSKSPKKSGSKTVHKTLNASNNHGSWLLSLGDALQSDVKQRKYDYTSVRDLLRFVRNKRHHLNELTNPDARQQLAISDQSFFDYFFHSRRFFSLPMRCFNVASIHCKGEETFMKYMRSSISDGERLTGDIAKSKEGEVAGKEEKQEEEEEKEDGSWYSSKSRWLKDTSHCGVAIPKRSKKYMTKMCKQWMVHESCQSLVESGACSYAAHPYELRVVMTGSGGGGEEEWCDDVVGNDGGSGGSGGSGGRRRRSRRDGNSVSLKGSSGVRKRRSRRQKT